MLDFSPESSMKDKKIEILVCMKGDTASAIRDYVNPNLKGTVYFTLLLPSVSDTLRWIHDEVRLELPPAKK